MSTRLDALDKLNRARNLFEAALMAVADIDEDRQRKALDTLLYNALEHMEDGLELIQLPEPVDMTGGQHNA